MNGLTRIALLSAAVLLSACTGESAFPEATGKGSVRAINAIEASPEISFLIEERLIGGVGYASVIQGQQWDDLEYTFNIEVRLAGDTQRTRVASQIIDVVADTEYTLLISGSLANPDITVWEAPLRTFDASDTDLELRFAHASESLGSVDVYVAAPGTMPVLGQEVGTLSFGEMLPAANYAGGDYEVILTDNGDPTTIRFTSSTLTLNNGTGLLMTFFDGNENVIGPIAVNAFNNAGMSNTVPDVNFLPTARFIHASMDLATSDIYLDEMLTNLILMDHAFGDISGDLPVPDGSQTLRYTPTGSTASILLEDTATFFGGAILDIIAVGQTDALSTLVRAPDRASVSTLVKFSLLHTANNHPVVDVYIVEADSDITEQFPVFAGVSPNIATASTNLAAGSQDLYVTVSNEKTVIAGPIRMDTVNGDIVDVLVLDTVDPATADVVFIPPP